MPKPKLFAQKVTEEGITITTYTPDAPLPEADVRAMCRQRKALLTPDPVRVRRERPIPGYLPVVEENW